MAQEIIFRNIQISSNEIEICKIGVKDLWQALKEGFEDFNANPSLYLFLFVFYPLIAVLVTLFSLDQNLMHLAFPLVSGFTLFGPVVLVCLYEMSRYRERGLAVNWRSAFDFVHSSSFATVLALSVMMMVLYVAWLYIAQFLYFGRFGEVLPTSITDLLNQILTTKRGAGLIVYGTAIGFIFAVVAMSVSVISFPLALDKPVSATTAVTASIKAVASNPLIMALWGIIVSVLLIMGTMLFLIGLIVVIPVLGHATWHLYRKLVKP